MPPSLQKLICVSRLKCMLYADHVLLPKSLRRPPHTTETAILHVPLPTGALRSPLGTVCATMKGCSNYASTYRQRHNRVHTHWNCAAVITACEATAGANPFDAASQCRSPEQMLRQTLTHTHRLSIPISSPHMFHILRQTNVFFAGVALTFKKPQSHLRHRRMATLPDASTQRSPHAHPGRQNPRSALENPTPVSRFHCASAPAVDDIHPDFGTFIRAIRPLLRSVGIWQRCANSVLGSIGSFSGKEEEGTTPDTTGQGPAWIPHVWCPLALTHRCRPHYRVWTPRVRPPP